MGRLKKNLLATIIYLLMTVSGLAALSWEVIWQIKASLALGISAFGTAITLIVVMGGMSAGAYFMGKLLHDNLVIKACWIYGWLEITIGVAGLFLNPLFFALEKMDTWIFSLLPSSLSFVYLIGIVLIFSIPTLCMGATLPLIAQISKQYHLSITKLYSLNTLGAAVGVLIVAFALIPSFGVAHTIFIIANINIFVGLTALILARSGNVVDANVLDKKVSSIQSIPHKGMIVFITGFALFVLEIAWFRSLAIIYPNTTDVFALMLACILIALGIAAKKTSMLKQRQISLGTQLAFAGILVLLITPLMERLDSPEIFLRQLSQNSNAISEIHEGLVSDSLSTYLYFYQTIVRFIVMFTLIYFPVRFLGVALPWLLDNDRTPSGIGKLYTINTFAAIIGSISAAWFLLPTVGFAKTAWFAGVLLLIGGLLILSNPKRFIFGLIGMIALSMAIFFETGIGNKRFLGHFGTDRNGHHAKLLGFYEGPDVTTSAVEYEDGARALLVNSTLAAWESGKTYNRPSAHYMAWMGHLPMMLHANPKTALVICFGTGQTANAVKKEGPHELDIVDINPTVFKLAHYFNSNENVLNDKRVSAIIMDGRAYMRRTNKTYDVITLEPMPPHSIGVNALYSLEFYKLARKKLNQNGIIAQWLPFHSVSSFYAASITKTFTAVFPNAMLWIDSDSRTGILVGMKGENEKIGKGWPGFKRKILRNLSNMEVQTKVAFDALELAKFSSIGAIITDDNQLLSYGKGLYPANRFEDNLVYVNKIKPGIKLMRPIDVDFQ